MTLILAAVCGQYAFHASDRLTTTDDSPRYPGGEFDAHSNKTVIVCGSDCWLAIGYTGVAFLEGRPTDQLIAEALTGFTDLSGGGMGAWFQPKLHYREIRNRIEAALAAAYLKLPTKQREIQTTVLAAGIQRKGDSIKQVMFRVVVDHSGSFGIEVLPNEFFRRKFPGGPYRLPSFYIARVGTMFKTITDAGFLSLKQYVATDESTPEGFRDRLMDEIVLTGAASEKVGRDAMGVIIDVGANTISTHFRLAEQQKHSEILARVHKRLGDAVDNLHGNTDGVPTPWMLGNGGMMFGPSFGTGGWTSVPDGFKYQVTGLPERDRQPGELMGAYFASQPRRDQYGRYR